MTTTSSICSTGWLATASSCWSPTQPEILLVDAKTNLRVVAFTNEETAWMELPQLEADEGPCVECFRSGTPVSVADLAEDAARWTRFVASMRDHGTYSSAHALQLRHRGRRSAR